MTTKRYALAIFILALGWASGCNRLPGKPTEADRWVAPSEVADFDQLYGQSCAGGHGSEVHGSIIDPNYYRLVSDQALRTTVIVGRPDMGKPDWRANTRGHPMSAQDVSDVVAWLAAQRPKAVASEQAQPANPSAS